MTREDLVDHIRPLVEQVASELAEELWARLEAQLEQAFDAARSALASDLADDAPVLPSPVAMPRRTPVAHPAAPHAPLIIDAARFLGQTHPSTAPTAPRPAPTAGRIPHNKGGRMVCTVCKEPGHNARRHKRAGGAPAARPAQPSTTDEEDGGASGPERDPVPRRARPSRTTTPAEDLPVIPHASLVAMLRADRAHNDVGDAGGVVLRADRAPSLIGHTEERREVCPLHGWVGRLAFDRERHDLCVPAVEPADAVQADAEVPPSDDLVRADVPTHRVVDGVRHRERRSAPRATTIARKALTREVLRIGRAELDELDAEHLMDIPRPRTRAERGTARPCPFVGCRHHLYLDVDAETGSIKLNFPEIEPEDLAHSCALDAADEGPHTLDAIGERTNVTRERARQVEVTALMKLREPAGEVLGVDAGTGVAQD